MTIIVEDGSRPVGANSYISVAEADTYFEIYKNDAWAGEIEDKEHALIQATAAVELLFGHKFIGHINNARQDLLFPRYAFYDTYGRLHGHNSIPKCLRDAVCEVAVMQLNFQEILPEASDISFIKKKSVTIDVIKQDIEYNAGYKTETYPGYRKVELILKPILIPENLSNVRLGL